MTEPWNQGGYVQIRGEPPLAPLPERPRPVVAPYEHPSDGSTLVLLDKPAKMTRTQVVSMAHFNSKPRYSSR